MSNKTEVGTEAVVDGFEDFYLSDTIAIAIENPKTGEPMLYEGKPVRAHVFGPSTKVHEKAQDRLNKEATKRVLAAAVAGKKKVEEADPDADIKFLIAVTEYFENFPFPGGVEAIYRNPKLCYINRQVQQGMSEMGNFFVSGEKD